MRLRTALVAAFPVALFVGVPLVVHATGIPFWGPIVGPPGATIQTCAANWAGLLQVVNNIIAFALTMAIVIVAPLSLAYAGFLYVVNPVNPAGISQAHRVLTTTIVGIFVALAAWLIVDAVLSALTSKGVSGWTSSLFGTGSSTYCLPISTSLNSSTAGSGGGIPGSTTTTISNDAACANNGGVYSDADGNVSHDSSGAVECTDGTFKSTTVDTGSDISAAQACADHGGVDTTGEGSTSGASYLCQDGTTQCRSAGASADNDCAAGLAPTVTGGGAGTQQCADDNTNCSQQALAAAGLSPSQAAAMSCIAYSENGGNAIGYSGTGPCGTFQISQANAQTYAPSQCSASDVCTNADCNLNTAVNMFNASGYQPWTGVNSSGQHWNSAAVTCQETYDPNTTVRITLRNLFMP